MSEQRRYLNPGAIRQLDHVTLICPAADAPKVIAFWEGLGMVPMKRHGAEPINHAGAGDRLDFEIGGGTRITYRVVELARHVIGTLTFVRRHFFGHIALRVGPEDIRALLEHPALDATQGRNGLIRWDTCDYSVFLNGPHGLLVEFRCPSANTEIDSLPD